MKRSAWLISLLAMLVSAGAASADVTGEWDIDASINVKVAIKGLGSETENARAVDRFVFHSDRTFEMIDFEGTWTPAGKKVLIHLDRQELEQYFTEYLEAALEEEGLEASIDNLAIIQNSFACKENKAGTAIAGNWKLVLTCSLYVPERSRTFNLKVTSKTAFTGTRAAAAGLSAAGGEGASLAEEIGGRIRGLLGGALGD
jgi:hypothetical protein